MTSCAEEDANGIERSRKPQMQLLSKLREESPRTVRSTLLFVIFVTGSVCNLRARTNAYELALIIQRARNRCATSRCYPRMLGS